MTTPDQPGPSESLTRLFEREHPDVSVSLPASEPTWRTLFDARRRVVALLLTPVMLLVYRDAVVPGTVDSAGEWLVLGLLGALAATIWATFVPLRTGARTAASSPCGVLAGVYPVLALLALSGQPLVLANALLAVAFLGWGLVQRLRGPAACGV